MRYTMSAKEALNKYKPLIIVVILFLLVFSIRAQAVNISAVPEQDKFFYENASGLPYYSEMDSYFNYRMTQDYLDHGYLGDTKINGTDWDLHSYYPPGRAQVYSPLIAWLTAYTYKLINLFAKIPLVQVAFWMGAFIASLAVIPAYLFVRRITNDYGGITAAIVAAAAPWYFSHTYAGFFDTDMFNLVLPLMIVWMFVESIRARDMRNKTIFAVLSAVFMLIFSLAWEGWVYIFYIVVIATVVYLLVSNYLFKYRTIESPGKYKSISEWFQNQSGIYVLVIFIILSSVLIMISSGASGFVSTLLGPVGFTQIQSTVQATSYPNVYVSVAELQIPAPLDAITTAGGVVAFIFALMGIFLLFWRLRTKGQENPPENTKAVSEDNKPKKSKRYKSKRRKAKQEAKKVEDAERYIIPELTASEKRNYVLYAILLVIWMLATAYALTKGIRFVEVFILPVALGAGIFVGLIYEYVKHYIRAPSYRTLAMIILVIAAAITPISGSYAIAEGVTPGTNDAMVNSLNWIKQNTPNNTVITSWWDFGHLFAAVADRPVTFDGSTQNSPRAYWVGKALVTNNESLSTGIMRMLTSSGDLAPLTLDNYTKSTGKSVEILNNILGVDKSTAYTILTTQYNLTPDQSQTILQYTHPDNPAPYVLITSSDMVVKAGWWSYFGNWNFQTNNTTAYSYLPGQATKVPSNQTGLGNNTTVLISQDNAVYVEATGNNISAGYINVNQIQNQNMTVSQLIPQLSAALNSNSSNLVIKPHKLIVVQDNNITMDEVVSNSSPISIILSIQNGTVETYVMNKELEDSMFTRLYILNGQNLTQYKMVYQQPGVMVWQS